MISLSSAFLLFVYCVTVLLSNKRPMFAVYGLMSFIVMLSIVAAFKANQADIIQEFGRDGLAYRWNAAMAFVSFLWFMLIQNTQRLTILIPVAIIFSLDLLCMFMSGINTKTIDPLISAVMVSCHLIYCFGCIHGSFARRFDANRSHAHHKKAVGGLKKWQ